MLELGAGTGRVTAALAGAGYEVVGVELSEAMLQGAERRLANAELSGLVTLAQGDMRDIDLGRHFALVLAPFNALMHLYTLSDQDRALANILRHLERSGAFACDLFNPEFGRVDTLRREAEWGHVGGEAAELFLYQQHNPDAQTIRSSYYLDRTTSDGTLRREKTTLLQRYYHRFEFERLLQHAGFGRVQLYGDFDKRPYRRSEPHLIAVANL